MAQVKTKVIKDDDMTDMFNQMLGTGDSANLNIIYGKYIQLENYLGGIVDITEKFAKSPFMNRVAEEHKIHIQQMLKFCTRSRDQMKEMFARKLPSEYVWNPNVADEETKTILIDAYESVKKHELTATALNLCDSLIQYRRYLADVNKLSHRFILNLPDLEFNPFPFVPTLNLKEILINMESEKADYVYFDPEQRKASTSVNAQLCNLCMLVLHKLYTISYNLYKVISSPDIDVDEFVNVIVGSIDQIKNQPNLSRCGKAFDKIKESVNMLRDNFSEYYKDFLETKNASIIMENFVIDVSQNTKSDPVLMSQFRRIISHYRSLAQNNIQDPRVRALFDKVNNQFNQMDKQNTNIVNIEKGTTEEYIDPEDRVREEEQARARQEAEERRQQARDDAEFKKEREANASKSVDELLKDMGIKSGGGKKKRSQKSKK